MRMEGTIAHVRVGTKTFCAILKPLQLSILEYGAQLLEWFMVVTRWCSKRQKIDLVEISMLWDGFDFGNYRTFQKVDV
jgi:hypothetical protein